MPDLSTYEQQADSYARRFRTEAKRFSELRPPEDGSRLRVDVKLIERCGRLLIQADQQGLLPDGEIRQAIAWHTAPQDPPWAVVTDSDGVQTGISGPPVRTPYALWLAIVGSEQQRVNRHGKAVISVIGPARTRGILPRDYPHLLDLDEQERYAEACEIIARVIEDKAKAGHSGLPATEPLTDAQQEVLDYIKANPGKKGRNIITALSIGSEAILTSRLIPPLKPRGVRNRRGYGYYWEDPKRPAR